MVQPTDFDARYRSDPDPFGVRTRWYERRKLAMVLASLGRTGYAAAWDPSCGTGDLVLALAERCDRVLASDASPRAVEITRGLVAGRHNVSCSVGVLPERPPSGGPFDLLAVTEVLYYLSDSDRAATYAMLLDVVAPDAELVTVHWRHHPQDAYLSGAAVTDELGDVLVGVGWRTASRTEDVDFVLASWVQGSTGFEHR